MYPCIRLVSYLFQSRKIIQSTLFHLSTLISVESAVETLQVKVEQLLTSVQPKPTSVEVATQMQVEEVQPVVQASPVSPVSQAPTTPKRRQSSCSRGDLEFDGR